MSIKTKAASVDDLNTSYSSFKDVDKIFPRNLNFNNDSENTLSTEEDFTPRFDKRSKTFIPEPTYRETLRGWWKGIVLDINYEEKFFSAHLIDVQASIESHAEFEFSEVFDDENNIDHQLLYEGAEFAFSVFTRHSRTNPITISLLEFSSPYIWQEGDDERSKKIHKKLFPDNHSIEL